MIQQVRKGDRLRVAGPDLDSDGSLPNRRDHLVCGDRRRNSIRQSQPVQTRSSQNNGVILALVQLSQPCIDITAQLSDFDIRSQVLDLGQTARAGGADNRANGQISQ